MIKYLILDVDGTLTDGGVYYDNTGNEMKKFSTKDGTGIVAAKTAGITIIVLTGRECAATTRRMRELHVEEVHQNVKDKVAWIRNWLETTQVQKAEVGYIGDDINDIGPMKLSGYIACPNDACSDVKAIADYVSGVRGGYGAVRDCIEHILRENHIWEEAINKAYDAGI